jgi:hypothetical protein
MPGLVPGMFVSAACRVSRTRAIDSMPLPETALAMGHSGAPPLLEANRIVKRFGEPPGPARFRRDATSK